MAAVSFGTVYQALAEAKEAAAMAGSELPVLSFISRYGNYLPLSQLNIIGQQFFGIGAQDYQSQKDFLAQLKQGAFEQISGGQTTQIFSLVKWWSSKINDYEYRTVASLIDVGEGEAELKQQIDDVLNAWGREYGAEEFEIVSYVWQSF